MKKKNLGILAALVCFCVLAAVLFQVWRSNQPVVQAGDKHIAVEVIHKDGASVEFSYDTEEEYLGALLQKEGLIAGSESAYGLFVETVDGETADYNVDKGWWKLSCNGADAQTGADTTPIQDGDRFTWTYTIG